MCIFCLPSIFTCGKIILCDSVVKFFILKRELFLLVRHTQCRGSVHSTYMLLLDVNSLVSCFCHLLSLYVLPWSIDLLSRVVLLCISPTSLPAHYFHPLPYRIKLVSIQYVCDVVRFSCNVHREEQEKKLAKLS